MSDNEEGQQDDEDDSENAQMTNSGDANNNGNAGRWTDEEHLKFLEALKIYGKNWNKVHRYVGTRTSAQTRSHAQKYFNKLHKKNTKEAHEELKELNRKGLRNEKRSGELSAQPL
jgi:SHAQKYF class myb-like DNA-binding protein